MSGKDTISMPLRENRVRRHVPLSLCSFAIDSLNDVSVGGAALYGRSFPVNRLSSPVSGNEMNVFFSVPEGALNSMMPEPHISNHRRLPY